MTTEAPATEAAVDFPRTGGSTLVVASDQTFWTALQLAALEQIGVENATNADLGVFFHQCTRTGLDPFLRQIYMIQREGKQTIQTGIDGFRLVARRAVDRTGETYRVSDTLWCGKDGQWSDVWTGDGAPHAAKVTVFRSGEPFSAVALYDEFAGKKRDGTLNSMWRGKQSHMIGKCAEALAHRKAFPQDLSGIYTDDELSHETIDHIPGEVSRPSDRVTAAEIIARRTAPAEPAVTVEPVAEMVDAEQRKRLGNLFDQHGMDRANAVAYTTVTIGRPVKSSDELTSVEAHQLITALEAIPSDPKTAAEPEPPVEAEIVEDPPAPISQPSTPAGKPQLNRLTTRFIELGCRSTQKRLAVSQQMIGRHINSVNDLTADEVGLVIDTLDSIAGAEQFADMFSEPAE